MKARNFSKAWSIWKEAWGFAFNPKMSGGYATLNLAALMLAPISAATIIVIAHPLFAEFRFVLKVAIDMDVFR